MALTETTFMERENHDLRSRLATFLYGQYSGERASRLARDIDCSPRTAQNILDRHWPNARCFQKIVQRWGRDVLEAVFSPDIEATLARAIAEERQLEEKLEAARARRRAVAGLSDTLPHGVGGTERAGSQDHRTSQGSAGPVAAERRVFIEDRRPSP